MMKISCPNCGAPIPVRQVNIQTMMGTCETCDTVFKLDESTTTKRKQGKPKLPRYIDVVEDGARLALSYRYRHLLSANDHIGLGVCISGVFMLIGAMIGVFSPLSLGSFGLAALFGSVLLFCLFWIAIYLLNTAHLDVDADTVRRYETPVFAFRNKTLQREAIERIECKPVNPKESGQTAQYHVMAILLDGTEVKLIDDVPHNYAFYIQQLLEETLANSAQVDVEAANTTYDSSAATMRLGDDGEIVYVVVPEHGKQSRRKNSD